MKFTDKQWEWIRWTILVLLIGILGFFNINTPFPIPPTPSADSQFGVLSTNQKVISNKEGTKLTVLSGGEIEMQSGAVLDVQSGTTGVVNATGVSATTITGTTFVLNGQTQSGAVRSGTASSYTSGTSITHGFTVTPTVCLISPMQNITATYTITSTGFSTNMQTTTNPIYWVCVR